MFTQTWRCLSMTSTRRSCFRRRWNHRQMMQSRKGPAQVSSRSPALSAGPTRIWDILGEKIWCAIYAWPGRRRPYWATWKQILGAMRVLSNRC